MPKLIYSKVKKDLLLLAINKRNEISKKRTDICPEDQYLQICTKIMPKGMTFKPHKHNKLKRETDYTCESWLILEGSVQATFWDVDDNKIFDIILESGDCAVVFRAGHSFKVLEENTVLYEFKSGPYYGVEKDKSFLDVENDI